MKFLLEHKILIPIKDITILKKGNIIRRVNTEKDQQGIFMTHDDKGGLVLVNVIDMKNSAFAAETGILRHTDDDKLYLFTKSFSKNALSKKAREILLRWPLYVKNPKLQRAIQAFLEYGFAPEQIIDFERSDNLNFLFIPLQQKFKIGRFEEKINWEEERKNRFKWHLEQLKKGEHLTYVALIPDSLSHNPLFYSIGTKPHESTCYSLRSEAFNFIPTNGGHIKCTEITKEGKFFIVDAGSSFLGKGKKSSLHTAKNIIKYLKRVYKKYFFTPVQGKGAFGTAQSY